MRTVMIVAGETSADLHGSGLVRELRARGVRVIGAGGRRMREAGMQALHDPTGHATVGLFEVVRNLKRYAEMYRKLVRAVKEERPSAVVLMDMPDFNLKLAAEVHKHKIPIVYYISPQIWAWRSGRVKTIRRLVSKMLVIFDFEEALYRRAGVDVTFVGHPLMDVIGGKYETKLRAEMGVKDEWLIGLLPGSRKPQFDRLFPLEMKTAERIRRAIPNVRYVVACAPNIDPKWASEGAKKFDVPVHVVHDRTYDVMAASDLMIISSGTSTVEGAIFGTPMIATYRFNDVSAILFGWFIKIKSYAMVNLIAGKKIVPEYYQYRARPELIANEAISMIRNKRLPEMRRALAEVRKKLGPPGAARRAAEEVMRVIC